MNTLSAQNPYKIHAHNDYDHELPFWYAYSNGAASIEADVIFVRDTLFVAHDLGDIQSDRTLTSLYLEPLASLAANGTLRPLQLLIDIKTEAYASLDKVVERIRQQPALMKNDSVSFVISGSRPKPEDYEKYPEFIYFDHQNLSDLDLIDLSKVAMVSRSFSNYSVWNGYGRMTGKDSTAVAQALETVVKTGKPFRFWGSPDTRTAWAAFAKLGVDYINTDKPSEAYLYLDKLDGTTFAPILPRPVYTPNYKLDADARPKNIILMIGDGNGLAQITAARMANRGKLSLTNIRTIGLINTASADDPVTDSAAGGTAMATGYKSDNRAIGVSPSGTPLPGLIEVLSDQNYLTGIITTDAIVGATPSSFYAHTSERDDTDKILSDLMDSKLDFFIAGGEAHADRIAQRYKVRELNDFQTLNEPTAVLNGRSKMPRMSEGRGDALPRSVRQTLSATNNQKKPFFLLVEAAQIDNGGHSNDITTIIQEMLDFDQAIAEALKFADEDGQTLVVITADHETGGLGIAGGDLDGEVRADFLSVDHTGILVPIFAYGPQADRFSGVYENSEVFTRILKAIGIKVDTSGPGNED